MTKKELIQYQKMIKSRMDIINDSYVDCNLETLSVVVQAVQALIAISAELDKLNNTTP